MKKFISWLSKNQQHIYFLLFTISIIMTFVSINRFGSWLEWSINSLMMYFFYMDARKVNTSVVNNFTIHTSNVDTDKLAEQINKTITNKLGRM
jgi:hypothetical protein